MDKVITLRNLEFPACAVEALNHIVTIFLNRSKPDITMEIIAEFIFLEGVIGQQPSNHDPLTTLSLIQEFQMAVVLADFFSKPAMDATRNAVFLSLFGGSLTISRQNVLTKLMSIAVSASLAPVLSAGGTWMQQLGPTSTCCKAVAISLVYDFVVFSNHTQMLRSMPMVAPRFAVNFMTAVAENYLNDINRKVTVPPVIILETFADWIVDNPQLLLASQTPPTLPAGAIIMPVITPLAGFIRWCALAPLYNAEGSYSRMHLALLQSVSQSKQDLPASNSSQTAISVQSLIVIMNAMKTKISSMAMDLNEEDVKLMQLKIDTSLERFAKAVHILLRSNYVFGNMAQLLYQMKLLPTNTLLQMVIEAESRCE